MSRYTTPFTKRVVNKDFQSNRPLVKSPSVKSAPSQNGLKMKIRVITKLPNTEQSSKGKGKTHKSTNRQNQSTTEKLGKLQWP